MELINKSILQSVYKTTGQETRMANLKVATEVLRNCYGTSAQYSNIEKTTNYRWGNTVCEEK